VITTSQGTQCVTLHLGSSVLVQRGLMVLAVQKPQGDVMINPAVARQPVSGYWPLPVVLDGQPEEFASSVSVEKQ